MAERRLQDLGPRWHCQLPYTVRRHPVCATLTQSARHRGRAHLLLRPLLFTLLQLLLLLALLPPFFLLAPRLLRIRQRWAGLVQQGGQPGASAAAA